MPGWGLVVLLAAWLGCAATLVVLSGWAGLGLFLGGSALGCCGYLAAGWPGVTVACGAVLALSLLA
jgi:hypothetical protein